MAVSFRKIFEFADELEGLSRDVLPPQRDTEDYMLSFEVKDGEEGGSENTRKIIPKADIEMLRLVAEKRVVPPDDGSVVLGIYDPQEIAKYSGSSQHLSSISLGLSDWTLELNQIMKEDQQHQVVEVEYDSDSVPATPSKSRHGHHRSSHHAHRRSHVNLHDQKIVRPSISLFQRLRRLDSEIAPFFVFDADLVDLSRPDDPLDRHIPNDTYLAVEAGGINQHGMLVAQPSQKKTSPSTEPIRSAIFDRHSRLQHGPMADLGHIEDDSMAHKFERDRQRKLEKVGRIKQVQTLFDATATLIKSANKRNRDALQRANRANSQVAAWNHSQAALNHQNTKADLMEVELKYFHRPRMIRERNRVWHIHIKPAATETKKKSNDLTRIIHKDQDRSNLSLADNNYPFVLLEYVEEFPPVMLNFGMASTILHYFRSDEVEAEGQDEEEDGNKKEEKGNATPSSEQSKKIKKPRKEQLLSSEELATISRTLEENNCRLPRHVMLLLSLRNAKRPYQFDATVPRFKLGQTRVLSAEDESPFLGNIESGEIQAAFCNNLFQAPIFAHKVPSTDFLLIRTKLTHTEQHFSIREIPHLYLAGQIEPFLVVPRPSTNKITAVQEKFYKLSILRELMKADGVNGQEVFAQVLRYCAKEKASPHKASHRSKFRDLLAYLGESDDRITWVPRDFGNSEEAYQNSIEGLTKSFTPEEVCLQESCNAAEYRLFQQHVTDIDLGKVQRFLYHMHRVKVFADERLKSAEMTYKELVRRNVPFASRALELIDVLTKDRQRKERIWRIARFIFDRLIQAPWNTTEAFVKSVVEKDGKGRMSVEGVGDPSGRGEGFAFFRVPRSAAQQQRRETVKLVGTDKDLRKLTKVDAIKLLVAFGVKAQEAEKLRRWDRIHMIREYCNNMDKMGVVPTELQKYVRDANNNNMAFRPTEAEDREDHFKRTCQNLWIAQKKALSSALAPVDTMSKMARRREQQRQAGWDMADAEEMSPSDAENSDDDDDDDDDVDLGGALQARQRLGTSSQAAKRRVDEDRRDFDQLNKILSGQDDLLSALTKDAAPSAAQPSNAPPFIPPQKVVRRLTRSIDATGKETIRIEFIFDPAEVRRVETSTMRQKLERQKRRNSLTAFTDSTIGSKKSGDDLPLSMSLNFSQLKNKSHQKAESGAAPKGRRKSAREEDHVSDEEDEEAEFKVTKSMTKNRSKAPATISPAVQARLPRVALAAFLENQVMIMWKSKHSLYFKFPVDTVAVPNYRLVVEHPISLLDMFDKIAVFRYNSVDDLAADVHLMVSNCEKFNTLNSPITKTVHALRDLFVKSVQQARSHGGQDVIKGLESEIASQRNRLAMQRAI